MADISAVIFSKDRALQLEAALRSFFLHCKDLELVNVHVLYLATNKKFARQYKILAAQYPKVQFIIEKNFRNTVLLLTELSPFTLFAVDDCIFFKDFSLSVALSNLRRKPKALGFSMRLGRNINYCYPLRKTQTKPTFKNAWKKVLSFDWTSSDGDFGYPLEVSSSIYRRSDLRKMFRKLSFKNPNTLEAGIYERRVLFSKTKALLLCYPVSVAFCNPLNMVQKVFTHNRVGSSQNYSVDNFRRLFDRGYRIDINKFKKFVPRGCHQEVKIQYEK